MIVPNRGRRTVDLSNRVRDTAAALNLICDRIEQKGPEDELIKLGIRLANCQIPWITREGVALYGDNFYRGRNAELTSADLRFAAIFYRCQDAEPGRLNRLRVETMEEIGAIDADPVLPYGLRPLFGRAELRRALDDRVRDTADSLLLVGKVLFEEGIDDDLVRLAFRLLYLQETGIIYDARHLYRARLGRHSHPLLTRMNSAVCAFMDVYNFVTRGRGGENDPLSDIEKEVYAELAAMPRA